METKCSRERIEKIINGIDYNRSFTVNAKGSNGGLAMMWKLDNDIEVETYTNFHISFKVVDGKTGKVELRYYGNPVTTEREGNWQLLIMLQP